MTVFRKTIVEPTLFSVVVALSIGYLALNIRFTASGFVQAALIVIALCLCFNENSILVFAHLAVTTVLAVFIWYPKADQSLVIAVAVWICFLVRVSPIILEIFFRIKYRGVNVLPD